MPNEFCYNYYITSYTLRSPTEGVPRDIHLPYIRRSNPIGSADDPEPEQLVLPDFSEEKLILKVSPINYRLMWDPESSEWFMHGRKAVRRGMSGMESLRKQRNTAFNAKFVDSPAWAVGLGAEAVEKVKADYKAWVTGRPSEDHGVEQQEPAASEKKEVPATTTSDTPKESTEAKDAKDEEMADVAT